MNTCTMSVVTVGLRTSLMSLLISIQQRRAINYARVIVRASSNSALFFKFFGIKVLLE